MKLPDDQRNQLYEDYVQFRSRDKPTQSEIYPGMSITYWQSGTQKKRRKFLYRNCRKAIKLL